MLLLSATSLGKPNIACEAEAGSAISWERSSCWTSQDRMDRTAIPQPFSACTAAEQLCVCRMSLNPTRASSSRPKYGTPISNLSVLLSVPFDDSDRTASSDRIESLLLVSFSSSERFSLREGSKRRQMSCPASCMRNMM